MGNVASSGVLGVDPTCCCRCLSAHATAAAAATITARQQSRICNRFAHREKYILNAFFVWLLLFRFLTVQR